MIKSQLRVLFPLSSYSITFYTLYYTPFSRLLLIIIIRYYCCYDKRYRKLLSSSSLMRLLALCASTIHRPFIRMIIIAIFKGFFLLTNFTIVYKRRLTITQCLNTLPVKNRSSVDNAQIFNARSYIISKFKVVKTAVLRATEPL